MPFKNSLFVLMMMFCVINQDIIAFQNSESGSVTLDSNKLTINGTSNVNDFKCVYEEDVEEGANRSNADDSTREAHKPEAELVLIVDSFDCGKRGINRDFRNTLKSDIYPTINVELIEVIRKDDIPTVAIVNISMVGVTREYGVELGEAYVDNDETLVPGSQNIKMSDFGLDPPSALLGLIKVRDELTIQFSLRVL